MPEKGDIRCKTLKKRRVAVRENFAKKQNPLHFRKESVRRRRELLARIRQQRWDLEPREGEEAGPANGIRAFHHRDVRPAAMAAGHPRSHSDDATIDLAESRVNHGGAHLHRTVGDRSGEGAPLTHRHEAVDREQGPRRELRLDAPARIPCGREVCDHEVVRLAVR